MFALLTARCTRYLIRLRLFSHLAHSSVPYFVLMLFPPFLLVLWVPCSVLGFRLSYSFTYPRIRDLFAFFFITYLPYEADA